MKCALCGHTFDETVAAPACGRCPMAHSCTLVRCPNCGYESPVEPSWIKKVRQFFKRKEPPHETQ